MVTYTRRRPSPRKAQACSMMLNFRPSPLPCRWRAPIMMAYSADSGIEVAKVRVPDQDAVPLKQEQAVASRSRDSV
jgi:hypothetical protein